MTDDDAPFRFPLRVRSTPTRPASVERPNSRGPDPIVQQGGLGTWLSNPRKPIGRYARMPTSHSTHADQLGEATFVALEAESAAERRSDELFHPGEDHGLIRWDLADVALSRP